MVMVLFLYGLGIAFAENIEFSEMLQMHDQISYHYYD